MGDGKWQMANGRWQMGDGRRDKWELCPAPAAGKYPMVISWLTHWRCCILQNSDVKRILLVDDDAFIVEVYGRRLREGGLEVRTARDGTSALEALQSAKPDAAVLDLMLPGFNG